MTPHMTPEEFRRNGYAAVDWVANYLETVDEHPVYGKTQSGDIAAALPEHAPEQGEPFEHLLADLDSIVVPGITHWQSPNWHAFFPANTSPPSILAELVTAGLGVQGMMWSTSPAATEIENVVLDWLVDLMGLPQTWKTTDVGGGVIQMSASDSNHAVLVVARKKAGHSPSSDMVVYVSDQAHSSIEKGCTIAGIGHCRKIVVDEEFAMDASALEATIEADIAAGLTPICIVSCIGTTGTTAVDPIEPVSKIARRFNIWHHVDAAYAGNAMICEEFRHYQPRLELVDSYTFNPHKWLMVNFDCNVLWVADREPLVDTMSILPPYLRNVASDSGEVIDYRDWHVPLGRRFRALKLWWVIRSYGAAGLRSFIREHVRLADDLAQRIEGDDRFAIFAPHPFGLVCFTLAEGNEATSRLATTLNESGEVAVTPSSIDNTTFIRVAIGQTYTGQEHVDLLWELIDRWA
ncbi:MAG: pyridoxal phosphate-dependent decarboxylase family protein [Acidimicrobiia bacterium]